MLFNLFRGTGIKGLTGIPVRRDMIVRPLLCCTRQEIEHYLKSKNISYCSDATNKETEYSRNKIRLELLPYIKNNINRKVNCETANLNKIVNSSVKQINDIKYLREKEKFNELPEQLREIAEIREENPDASLEELGKLLKNPIGKSGVNHRLRKIQQIAEELRK